MKYLIPLILVLSSCNTIRTVDHPIDEEKQEALVNRESPVIEIDLFNVSIMICILSVLIFFIWYIGWKKRQKSVVEDS